MKSALVVGAACELGVPAIAGGGETDCCALAVTVASAQRQITSMKRFTRRASQQSWMKNQSNRFLEDSAPMGSQIAKICEAGCSRRWLLRRFVRERDGRGSHACSTETDRADAAKCPRVRMSQNA